MIACWLGGLVACTGGICEGAVQYQLLLSSSRQKTCTIKLNVGGIETTFSGLDPKTVDVLA